MIKKFFVEIETENEINVTTAKDIHLALVKYFVAGVHIRVDEAAQLNTQRTDERSAADIVVTKMAHNFQKMCSGASRH